MIISLKEAISILKSKGTPIAIPTETVYGLAASIDDEEGINAIYQLKNRPNNKPLSIQIADVSDLNRFTSSLPPDTEKIANAFWPGPLTLILPANLLRISAIIRANLPTVGIRIPDHPLTIELIKEVGPIVAPSANLSDKPPPLFAEEIQKIYGKDFPILDGGICRHGISSTLLSYENNAWQILRKGTLTEENLKPFLFC